MKSGRSLVRRVERMVLPEGYSWESATLTFAGDSIPDDEGCKRIQVRVCEWLRRHQVTGLWVWGVHESGIRHIHLLLEVPDGFKWDKLRAYWHKRAGASNENHLKLGVHLEKAKTPVGWMVYCADSGRKDSNTRLTEAWTSGRWWGQFGDVELLPEQVVIAAGRLSEVEIKGIIRRFRLSETADKRAKNTRRGLKRDRGWGKIWMTIPGTIRAIPGILRSFGIAIPMVDALLSKYPPPGRPQSQCPPKDEEICTIPSSRSVPNSRTTIERMSFSYQKRDQRTRLGAEQVKKDYIWSGWRQKSRNGKRRERVHSIVTRRAACSTERRICA